MKFFAATVFHSCSGLLLTDRKAKRRGFSDEYSGGMATVKAADQPDGVHMAEHGVPKLLAENQ